jgi:hypothetical protein
MKIEEWQKFPQADRIEYMLEERRYDYDSEIDCAYALLIIIFGIVSYIVTGISWVPSICLLVAITFVVVEGLIISLEQKDYEKNIEKLDEKYRKRNIDRILKGRR